MALKVLHINAFDSGGGAARSAFRLHSTLRSLGHGSKMLVRDKVTSDVDVRALKQGLVWRAADRVCTSITETLDLQYVFYPSSFALAADPWFQEADVVQLYNVHPAYFSHSALPFLSRRKPVVWRFSDMWPLTGHVAYSYECERWRLGCGSCPHLAEYPHLRRDTTALLWRWKRAVYRRSRLAIVAPSRWMEGLVRASPLVQHLPLRWIPNGVDVEVFRPVARAEARRELGLDPDRPVVYFSAPDLDDPRKGGAVLEQALALLVDLDFDLLVTGGRAERLPDRARFLGRVDDNPTLALTYAAADVFVLPTLADNLPNAVLESLACGTPCVSFAVGGLPDAVRHLETGWLAQPGNIEELAEGIRALLQDDELRGRLAERARETAEGEYSATLEADRFVDLYTDVVGHA